MRFPILAFSPSDSTSAPEVAAAPVDGELVAGPGEVIVNIVKPFSIRLDADTVVSFKEGWQVVSEGIAGHWYFPHHTDNAPPPMLQPGTPEFVAEQARKAARDRLIEAVVDQQAEQAALAARAGAREAAVAAADEENAAAADAAAEKTGGSVKRRRLST